MYSPRKKKLGYWCSRASAAFHKELERRYKQYNLGFSEGMLLIVLKYHGSQPLVNLAKNLEHAHPSVLRNIDSLEKNGYVIRSKHPNDRRVKIVCLTKKGEELSEVLDNHLSEVQEMSLKGFSEDESDKLIKDLRQIVDNLGDLKELDKHINDNCCHHH